MTPENDAGSGCPRPPSTSEALLQLQSAAVNAAADAIMITDRAGTIVWVNPSFSTLTGYTSAEAIGRNPRDLIKSTRQEPKVYQQMWQTILAGQTWRGELVNRRKDGGHYAESLTITPVRADGGGITHFVAIKQDLTEREHAQDALIASERLFQSVFEQATVGLVIAEGRRGRFVRVNHRFCEMVGYTAEELLHTTSHDITHPDDLAGDTEQLERISLGTVDEISREKRYRRKDGSVVWAKVLVAPLDPTEAGPKLRIGVIEDITGQRQAGAILRASEVRYRRLFETAKDGILILDAITGMVVDVNPYLIERLGFSRDQFLGKQIWDLGFFRDIIANQDRFLELQRNEYIRYEDKPLETAAGGRIDVEFVSNVYLVNDERVIQCNIRDITARKRADRQLGEQREILSNSHEGVMIVNLVNQVSSWNRGAEEIFGWTAAEALGRPPAELLGIDDPGVLSALRAAVERDGFWNGELPALARDGRKLTVNCRTTLVRDQAGRPRAHLSFLADITEKKQLEKIFLRTQRLEAIGTLSSGISHDLNNILAPILMASAMLRDTLADPRDRDLMGVIGSSARRGAEIIRQLLTFSRGIEGERVPVQVRHLIKETAAIARETFPRNITLIEEAEAGLWPVIADATQLHQVLMNLCVNARDAMPDGGELTIAAENVRLSERDTQLGVNARNGPHVLLTVRDTGHGIPRAIIDRVFEPFFTTKSIGRGTGLGLSTVLGIVRSHGGAVTVYSEPAHGSVFKVYLPATPEGDVTPTSVETAELARGQGETILVVDDEEAILAATRYCLEGHGYRVLTAKNGQEALAVFDAHRREVKIVITDVMMPVMDGLKLARALRELDAAVRVIASSGLEPEAKSTELAAGIIVEFLSKPYDRSTLLAAVRRQWTAAAFKG